MYLLAVYYTALTCTHKPPPCPPPPHTHTHHPHTVKKDEAGLVVVGRLVDMIEVAFTTASEAMIPDLAGVSVVNICPHNMYIHIHLSLSLSLSLCVCVCVCTYMYM
jgi:hypothetical protein